MGQILYSPVAHLPVEIIHHGSVLQNHLLIDGVIGQVFDDADISFGGEFSDPEGFGAFELHVKLLFGGR
ncbi:MAG: hypothetical protein WDO73_18085 [Ignavibacteriota bacterium]